MKSVEDLLRACLKEAGTHCRVATTRDEVTLNARLEHEGLAFAAITLPAFDKDLCQALALGRIDSNHFAGFQRSGGLPRFLGGFLRRIFHVDGTVRVDADAACIHAVRQVCLLLSKVEVPVSERRVSKALADYVHTDQAIEPLDPRFLEDFRRAATVLLGRYFDAVEQEAVFSPLPAKHGSGAVADRTPQNGKWACNTWTDRLHEVYPWWDDLAVNWRDALRDVEVLAPSDEPPVRVTTVPKTLKGPRIIAMEPHWMMFVQQGLLAVFGEVLERPAFRTLYNTFGWLDQEPNRLLSKLGSIDGSYSTIDLSEASDRVSLELVESLFHRHPALLRRVLACRSARSDVAGETVELRKFASMGSALCFPVETFVFATLAFMGMGGRKQRVDSSWGPYLGFRVFGDDIIVPEEATHCTMALLEASGLKVNERKTFTTGRFRESCGADWFRGTDVSVFRVRALLPECESQYELIRSAIELHNRAFKAGYESVARMVAGQLLQLVPGLPYGEVDSPLHHLWTYSEVRYRRHKHLQRRTVRTVIFKEVKPSDPLDGYGALRKVFRVPRFEPLDLDHLQRDGRSRCVGMTIGWVVAP